MALKVDAAQVAPRHGLLFGHENGFDGGLLLPEAAGFDFRFERRSIGEIIDGLRRVGNSLAVEFLEHWKEGLGDELGKTTQAVFKEHRFAAIKELIDLLLRPNPDKNPPTRSLDDLAYSLEDSFLWPPTTAHI